jgi:hypothetical protein
MNNDISKLLKLAQESVDTSYEDLTNYINETQEEEETENEDETEISAEQTILVNMSNIYLSYFKNLYNKKQSYKLFDELNDNDDESTNRCMELFYEDMLKFESSDDPEKNDLFPSDSDEIDINECDDLYALYIDNKHVYSCKFIMPIIKQLAMNDWDTKNWTIVPLKTNYDK